MWFVAAAAETAALRLRPGFSLKTCSHLDFVNGFADHFRRSKAIFMRTDSHCTALRLLTFSATFLGVFIFNFAG
jgi:hypothetical protein